MRKKTLEEYVRRELRMNATRQALLRVVAAAGIVSVALVAPNALQMLKPVVKEYERQRRYKAKSAFSRLVQSGYIRVEKNGKGSFATLTKKGSSAIQKVLLAEYRMPRPKRWDKKWRLIIFDIPETRKKLRGRIRKTLSDVGFKRLQDSVWVYPYACEEIIILLKAQFKIGKDLLYIIADKVENDQALRAHFGLQ